MEQLLFDLEAAAKVLGFKSRTLRKWIKEGKITARRGPRGALFISRDELQKFVETLPVVKNRQRES